MKGGIGRTGRAYRRGVVVVVVVVVEQRQVMPAVSSLSTWCHRKTRGWQSGRCRLTGSTDAQSGSSCGRRPRPTARARWGQRASGSGCWCWWQEQPGHSQWTALSHGDTWGRRWTCTWDTTRRGSAGIPRTPSAGRRGCAAASQRSCMCGRR